MPNNPKNDTPDKALVTLHACPPGLFRFGETIGFKTEYGMTICDDNGAEMPGHLVRFKVSNYPDAYVLESGEVFWGGAKSHAERSGLLVEPLTLAALSQPQHGGLVEAVARFIADYDDGDRADAGVNPLMEAHIRDFRAALASNSPVVGEDAPAMVNNTNHALPTGVWKPTPTDTADRREAVALHIIFDGPPGPEAGRFVECETPDGKSISAGDWREREDGFWELRIPASLIVVPDGMGLKPAIEAQMAAVEAKAAETLWEGAPLLKGLTGYIRAMIAARPGAGS